MVLVALCESDMYDPWKPTTSSLLQHYRSVTGIALVLCASIGAGGAYWAYHGVHRLVFGRMDESLGDEREKAVGNQAMKR